MAFRLWHPTAQSEHHVNDERPAVNMMGSLLPIRLTFPTGPPYAVAMANTHHGGPTLSTGNRFGWAMSGMSKRGDPSLTKGPYSDSASPRIA